MLQLDLDEHERVFVGVDLVTGRAERAPATAEAAGVVNGLREQGVLLVATLDEVLAVMYVPVSVPGGVA